MSGLDFATTIFRWLGYGRYNATAPSASDGDVGELQIDSAANLKVAIASSGELGGFEKMKVAQLSNSIVLPDGPSLAMVVLTSGLVKMVLKGDTNPQILYLTAGTVYRYKAKQIYLTGTDSALQVSGQIILFYPPA